MNDIDSQKVADDLQHERNSCLCANVDDTHLSQHSARKGKTMFTPRHKPYRFTSKNVFECTYGLIFYYFLGTLLTAPSSTAFWSDDDDYYYSYSTYSYRSSYSSYSDDDDDGVGWVFYNILSGWVGGAFCIGLLWCVCCSNENECSNALAWFICCWPFTFPYMACSSAGSSCCPTFCSETFGCNALDSDTGVLDIAKSVMLVLVAIVFSPLILIFFCCYKTGYPLAQWCISSDGWFR